MPQSDVLGPLLFLSHTHEYTHTHERSWVQHRSRLNHLNYSACSISSIGFGFKRNCWALLYLCLLMVSKCSSLLIGMVLLFCLCFAGWKCIDLVLQLNALCKYEHLQWPLGQFVESIIGQILSRLFLNRYVSHILLTCSVRSESCLEFPQHAAHPPTFMSDQLWQVNKCTLETTWNRAQSKLMGIKHMDKRWRQVIMPLQMTCWLVNDVSVSRWFANESPDEARLRCVAVAVITCVPW